MWKAKQGKLREGLLLGDNASLGSSFPARAEQIMRNINARRGELYTYQYWGKLSRSSSNQRSSSHSCCLSLGLLPSFWAALSVLLRVSGGGRKVLLLYLADSSDNVTAFRTSVMDVLAEA